MIDKEIMLLLGTALMETARHRIKISRNIFGLGHLCSGTEFERLDKKKELELIKTQFNDINLNYALKAWKLGMGYCGELSLIIAYLSCHIKINCQEKIYLSLINIQNSHTFCLLHQDQAFHEDEAQIEANAIARNFYFLNEIFPKNTVVIDPWINKTTLVECLDPAHLEAIKKYGVVKYYTSPLYTFGRSFEVDSKRNKLGPAYSVTQEMLDCFNHYYFTKLPKKTLDQNYGKPFSAMQKKLSLYVALEKLGDLLKKVNANLPQIAGFPENNDQVFYLKKAQRYVDRCVVAEGYLREESLKPLLFAVLRITTLAYKTNPPIFLDASTLTLAPSGKVVVDTLGRDLFYTFTESQSLGIYQMQLAVYQGGRTIPQLYWALCNYLHEGNITSFQRSAQSSQIHSSHALGQDISNLYLTAPARANIPPKHPLTHLYLPEYKQYCYQQLKKAMLAEPKAALVGGHPNFVW